MPIDVSRAMTNYGAAASLLAQFYGAALIGTSSLENVLQLMYVKPSSRSDTASAHQSLLASGTQSQRTTMVG